MDNKTVNQLTDLMLESNAELIRKIFKNEVKRYFIECEVILHQEAEKICGFVAYSRNGDEVFVDEIAVESENPFIAIKLLKKATFGAKRIVSYCDPNNKKIIEFYKRVGFKKNGENFVLDRELKTNGRSR